MTYTLKRSKRKTVAVYICNGFVEVRAPLKLPKHEIDKFVISKEKWINKHIAESQQQVNQRYNFNLNYGDTIYIMGTPHIITGRDNPFSVTNNEDTKLFIQSGMSSEQIKQACIEFYRLVALGHLIPRTEEIASTMAVKPVSIKINNAKKRWGSCGADGKINYAWRLIMADDNIIDYVIVHELAHLVEMNHSKRFWAIVYKYIPDFKECRKRLRALQIKLLNENWD